MSAPKSKSSYTSKGERKANRQISKAVKRERTLLDKWGILQKAWLKGKNPWVVVPNPNTADTKARYVRVRADTEWGDPRKGFMFGGAGKD
jgi:hypothetical protein